MKHNYHISEKNKKALADLHRIRIKTARKNDMASMTI